jgi:oxygen-independent coproporphyrinogen-3 oxidase
MLQQPPLSLYVHLPWCVRKCPYCDFNSHAVQGVIPYAAYLESLLADLDNDLPRIWGRVIHSIFIGGGTPSLFPAREIESLLSGIHARCKMDPAAEITLEANPGSVEHDRFSAYLDAGINRISLGVQSFSDQQLTAIGRVHDSTEARAAIDSLHTAGFDNLNLDLMFGLPGQTTEQALADVEAAVAAGPQHISHYQLTLEPNTLFAANPPSLPGEAELDEMQVQCQALLGDSGFHQYEVSAYARDGKACRHNLNYWKYGDYLGIGAGAHSKITDAAGQAVTRLVKHKHPHRYLAGLENADWLAEEKQVAERDLAFEFFLNHLRLKKGVKKADFSARTGRDWSVVSEQVEQAKSRGLLAETDSLLVATELGWNHLNSLQGMFLP